MGVLGLLEIPQMLVFYVMLWLHDQHITLLPKLRIIANLKIVC